MVWDKDFSHMSGCISVFSCLCVGLCVCGGGDIDINFQLLSILFFEKGLLLKLEHNDRF